MHNHKTSSQRLTYITPNWHIHICLGYQPIRSDQRNMRYTFFFTKKRPEWPNIWQFSKEKEHLFVLLQKILSSLSIHKLVYGIMGLQKAVNFWQAIFLNSVTSHSSSSHPLAWSAQIYVSQCEIRNKQLLSCHLPRTPLLDIQVIIELRQTASAICLPSHCLLYL